MTRDVLVFGDQWGAVAALRSKQYRPIVVHFDRNYLGADFICPFNLESLDHTLDMSLFEVLPKNNSIHGIVVCGDTFVESAPLVSAHLQLDCKCLTSEQAHVVRDKLRLKLSLTQQSIPTSRFLAFDRVWSFARIVEHLGCPFLIKPRRGALAQFITLIHTEDEWAQWHNSHRDVLGAYYGEEYLANATEYCCDTIIADGKILAQFPGEYSVLCLESNWTHCGLGVNFPGFLPTDVIEQLKELARHFLTLHDIRDGYCHMEFFYTNDGWKFGEIGWRPPGGHQLPTQSFITQTDLLDIFLRIFLKDEETPQEPLRTINPFVGYYLFPTKAGRVKSISTQLHHPWIVDHKVYLHEGQTVPLENSSVTKGAHVMYNADSLAELHAMADLAPTLVTIEYE